MLTHSKRSIIVTTLAVLFCIAMGAAASAQSLDELRRSGAIGERFDGLVVLHDAKAADDLETKVNEINAKRLAIYEKRATAEGVTAEQVGRVYAQQIFDEAPAGTWFLQENKNWLQKK